MKRQFINLDKNNIKIISKKGMKRDQKNNKIKIIYLNIKFLKFFLSY